MLTKKVTSTQRGAPGYRELAEKLRADIENGVYTVGRKMPTENVLQYMHNVSRHTVREALQILLTDGLIYKVQGSGTYVRDVSTMRAAATSVRSDLSTRSSSGPTPRPKSSNRSPLSSSRPSQPDSSCRTSR